MSDEREGISMGWAAVLAICAFIVGLGFGCHAGMAHSEIRRALGEGVSAEEKVRMIQVIIGPDGAK